MKKLMIVLLVLCCSGLCGAANYYVDPARPDNTGDGLTPETAEKTILAAYNDASNGDTIKLIAGTYDNTTQSWDAAGLTLGTAGKSVILEPNSSGGRITWKTSRAAGQAIYLSAINSTITFKSIDFDIDGSQRLFYSDSASGNVTFDNCTASNSSSNLIYINGFGKLTIQNNCLFYNDNARVLFVRGTVTDINITDSTLRTIGNVDIFDLRSYQLNLSNLYIRDSNLFAGNTALKTTNVVTGSSLANVYIRNCDIDANVAGMNPAVWFGAEYDSVADWNNVIYVSGDIRKNSGNVWKCILNHTALHDDANKPTDANWSKYWAEYNTDCNYTFINNDVNVTKTNAHHAILIGFGADGGEYSYNTFRNGNWQIVVKGSHNYIHDNLAVGSATLLVTANHGNIITNNKFICTSGRAAGFNNQGTGNPSSNANTLTGNIIVQDGGTYCYSDYALGDQNNIVNRNCYYLKSGTAVYYLDSVAKTLSEAKTYWAAGTANINNDSYSISADPCFVNYAAGDYNLSPDSPYFAMMADREPNLVAHWNMNDNTTNNYVINDGGIDGTYIGKSTVTDTYASLLVTHATDPNRQYTITAKTIGAAGNNITFKTTPGGSGITVTDSNIFIRGIANIKTQQLQGAIEANDAANALIYATPFTDVNASMATLSAERHLTGGYDAGEVNAITSQKSVAGKIGRALSFNGTTDYVDTNQTFQSAFRDSFTISLWCKPDDGQPSQATGLLYGGDPDTNSVNAWLNTDGTVSMEYVVDGENLSLSAPAAFTDGPQNWHLITFVIEQRGEKIYGKMYFDTTSGNESDLTAAMTDFSAAQNLLIGINTGIADSYFPGSLDDVRIYNKALSSDEVVRLYNNLLSDCIDVQDANYGLLSDLNGDCFVDYEDLKIVADNWLNNCSAPDNCGGADFAPINGTVDFADFSTFAGQWLQCNVPNEPDCIINW